MCKSLPAASHQRDVGLLRVADDILVERPLDQNVTARKDQEPAGPYNLTVDHLLGLPFLLPPSFLPSFLPNSKPRPEKTEESG